MRNFLRAVVVLAVLGIPSQALAAPAAIDHVTTFATGSFAVDDFFCLGPAVMTGTDTLRYETVETSRGFHVEGLDMGGFTAEIEGGATAVGGSNDRFAFNTGPGATINHDAHVDWVSVFAADGSHLFDATFRVVEQFTMTPDGTIRVDVQRVVFNDGPSC